MLERYKGTKAAGGSWELIIFKAHLFRNTSFDEGIKIRVYSQERFFCFILPLSNLPIYSSYLLWVFTVIQSWKCSKAQQPQNRSPLKGRRNAESSILTVTNFQVTMSAEVFPRIARQMTLSSCSHLVKTWFSDKCTKVWCQFYQVL